MKFFEKKDMPPLVMNCIYCKKEIHNDYWSHEICYYQSKNAFDVEGYITDRETKAAKEALDREG